MPVIRPSNLSKPFADSGSKNTIPVNSQIGIVNGAASYTDGFPPLTMTPIAAGGTPPFGQDMNGVLNAVSGHTVFQNAGGKYRFDATLATAIGGYPVGFVVQSDDGLSSYLNILAGNSTNFNTSPSAIGVSWIPWSGVTARQQPVLTTAGAVNILTAANAPPLTVLPANGFIQNLSITTGNTGATTYAPDGLAAKPVYGLGLLPLQGGELIAQGIAIMMYVVASSVNGGNGAWVLLECSGGASQIAIATQSNHAVTRGRVLQVAPIVNANTVTTPLANSTYTSQATFTAPCAGYVVAFGTLAVGAVLAGAAAVTTKTDINGIIGSQDTSTPPVTTQPATLTVASGTVVTTTFSAITNGTAPGATFQLHITAFFLPNP